AVHSFCPEGGRYLPSPDGKTIECSAHGSAGSPRQPISPVEANALGKLMRDFTDLTATLTFLPEGLRAVVTIYWREAKSKFFLCGCGGRFTFLSPLPCLQNHEADRRWKLKLNPKP